MKRTRVAILGYGYVGSYLYSEIVANPDWGLDVTYVWPGRKDNVDLPSQLILRDLEHHTDKSADIIVEAAHADVTKQFGVKFLATSSYMPLSLTALADSALERAMIEAARAGETCLYVPHGAAVGLDSLAECRDLWTEVTVTMRKNPKNLDFTAAQQWKADEIITETVLYDGPTRDVCALFPRNVNSHAAVALAGIGFDRTRSILIADPATSVSTIELQARGGDVSMHVVRENPLKGVSGVMTLRSILGSLQRACASGVTVKVV